jgi:hypothetical protein
MFDARRAWNPDPEQVCAMMVGSMDAELRAFLEEFAGNLESRMDRLCSDVIAQLRGEILEAEARLNARIDGMGRLAQDANRTLRTRDLRILTLEERMGEVEKRLLGAK